MIERYSLPKMATVWTQARKYERWLDVELAVCEVMEQFGKVPRGVASRIRRKVRVDPKRINAIEERVKHDVIAFLESIAEQAGKDSRHLHVGLTSSDVLDTALALQMTEASELLLQDLNALLDTLRSRGV